MAIQHLSQEVVSQPGGRAGPSRGHTTDYDAKWLPPEPHAESRVNGAPRSSTVGRRISIGPRGRTDGHPRRRTFATS